MLILGSTMLRMHSADAENRIHGRQLRRELA